VSPSNILIGLPGGARLAAGVAWLAEKAGVDASRWGLPGGRRGYGDLLAAFRAAKDGGGKAGWSAFMRGNEAAGSGGGPGSLDFVKGDRRDLAGAGGERLPKPGSVSGILSPEDAANRGEGEGVALTDGDLSGERASLVKSAFAGGFGSNPGAAGGAMVSGGAYVSQGFFGGGPGAASGKAGDRVKAGLDGLPAASAARGVAVAGGSTGKLSAYKANQIDARLAKGMKGARALGGQRAFVQLAEGRGRDSVSVAPNCTAATACPSEFAATNTGAIYDGTIMTDANSGILTTPDEPAPAVPLDGALPASADPAKLIECQNKVQQCEKARQPYYASLGSAQSSINALMGQMPGACGDPCHCGGCNSLKSQIQSICGGQLETSLNAIEAPCDLPAFCADLGVSSPSPAASGSSQNLCQMNTGKCGCTSFMCDAKCFVGS
jgi:hypothetical protein